MSSTTSQYDLSVIIVNYNGGDELMACLKSLAETHESIQFEVMVVDNDSSDNSIGNAERQYPQFRYLRAKENLGFARANNLALKEARGRHAMLLNPDTEVIPGALSILVTALDNEPSWGIVGPQMVDGKDKPYRSARRFPTPFDLFSETLKLNALFPWSKKLNGYIYGDCPLIALDGVEQIEGSALMISGKAREQVGELDPRFFIFFEEVDWCRRVHEAGFEVHVVRDATIRHHRSTTMSKHFEKIRRIHASSAMKYFLKHHGKAGLKRLRRYMRSALLIREMLLWIFMCLGGGRKARLRAKAAHAERAIYRRGLPA
ncbi:glycosyltransferase family 2 protein [bacterium]|nr:glycosyltransferase family 2 protein [bacterium]